MMLLQQTFALLFSLSLITPNLAEITPQDLAPRAPPPTDPFDSARTLCSPDECPQFCGPGDSTATSKRSFIGAPSSQWHRKRFFAPTDPDTLVNELLCEDYCNNLAATDSTPTTYEWHTFDNNAYASATKGLSGCTAIFVASTFGVFSSHIWEQDKNTNDDLQAANYVDTLAAMSAQLAPHATDLVGGEALIVMPSRTNDGSKPLYSPDIVTAITNAVNTASGLTATTVLYVPLDWKKSPVLGTNFRGTAAVEYDPNYESPTGVLRAYRLWAEKAQVSQKTWVHW